MKPREFWIMPNVSRGAMFRQVYFPDESSHEWFKEYKDRYDMIKVREVLPDEPDWKELCAELAQILKDCRPGYSEEEDRLFYKIRETLAKFEELKKK